MPFADDRGLVARLLQVLRGGALAAIEAIAVLPKTVQVRVLAGLNDGASGSANRIGHIALAKQDALRCQSIQVRRWSDFRQHAAIGADGLGRVIIGENEEDIGPLLFGDQTGSEECERESR